MGGLVAALYLFSNVVFAQAQETNLWTERRQKAADQRVASLPANMTGAAGPADLLRQIPALSRSLISNADPVRTSSESKLPPKIAPFLEAIPLNRAALKDVFLAPGAGEDSPAPFVIMVQDVHLNNEAQHNIAGVLGSLCDKAAELSAGHPLVVGVEAAFGPFDFKPFRVFSDKTALTSVAESFLASNRIAAPSYIGITSTHELSGFAGVDDATHYNANVDAYRAAQLAKTRVVASLAKASLELNSAKNKSLNPDLAKFDGMRSSYEQGQMGLGAYVTSLARLADAVQKADAPLDVELVVEQFLSAYKIEQSLDFARADRERSLVVEKLASKLSAEELKSLLVRGLAYRAGRIGFADFYRGIKTLIDKHGLSLAQTPAFDQYIRYVLLADGISGEKLFVAVRRTEDAVLQLLSRTDEERALMRRSRGLSLVAKLVTFGLTPDEWIDYAAVRSALPPLPDLSAFEAFYREADIRSEKIVANLMARIGPSAGARAAIGVLIVGGFHAPQISALLKKRGISYAVVQPKITKVDSAGGTEYLTVFTRDKAPLDQLFAGEKLFLGVSATEAGQGTGPAVVTNREIVAVAGAAQALRGGSTAGSGVEAQPVAGQPEVREIRAGGITFFATLRAGVINGFRSVAQLELPGIGSLQILTRPASIATMIASGGAIALLVSAIGWAPVVRILLGLVYAGVWARAVINAPPEQRLRLGAQGVAMVGLVFASVVFGPMFGGENVGAAAAIILPPGSSGRTPASTASNYPVTRVEAGAPNNVERASIEEMVSDIRVRIALRKMQKLTGLVPRLVRTGASTMPEAEQKRVLVALWTSLQEFQRESIRQQFMGGVEPAAADLPDALLRVARNGGQPFTGYSAYTGAGISMASGLPDWYDLRLDTVLAIVENSARDMALPSDVVDRIRLIFQNNWKISPERTFGTLYNFLGPELYGAMIALETGTPAASHFSLATLMYNGDIDHIITLNFDTLIERAAYSLGMWKVVPMKDEELAAGTLRIQRYNGQGQRQGDPVTVRKTDVVNGQTVIAGRNIRLFYVSDETTATETLLDGIGDLGIPILHKPHGSSESGREHTIIADFEGTGQAAFPEGYRRYLLKILLTNYVSVFGVSMRDPDHSGMVRYIVSLIKDTDADIGPNSEFTDDQRLLIRDLRQFRDYVGAVPEGRGVHLVSHLGSRGVEESFAPAQRNSMDDFAKSGRAKVTIANTSEAMEAVAGTRPPLVNDPTGPATDWRQTIRNFFRGWGQRVAPATQRDWLFGALLAAQEADPSGRFERQARASERYTGAAADGSLRELLRSISITPGKEVPALLALAVDPLALPPTLDELLKTIPAEDHPKVINGLYRLDLVFRGREGLYDQMKARGLLEDWQHSYLMGVSHRDHLDERAAYLSFGNAASQTPPYDVNPLIDGREAGRRDFFANPDNRAEFFRNWAANHQKLLALTEQFRLHRVAAELPVPDQEQLATAQINLRKYQGVFEAARRENPGVFDVGQERGGRRMTASTEESFLYIGFYSQLYALEAFQRDHKQRNSGPLSDNVRNTFIELNGFDEKDEEVVARIGRARIEGQRLAPNAGESPQAHATRVGAAYLDSYFAALAANDENASFNIFLQIKDIFLNEQIARMKKTGGEGGNFILLLDIYVSLVENATVSNDLPTAGKWTREADALKMMLTLGEDHWVVRRLAANKAYYQLKLAASTADPARRASILRQILGNAALTQRYEFAKDRSVWLMLKEVTALANFMQENFRLNSTNNAAVLRPFNEIMLWFEQNPAKLRNSELSGMIHIFSDYFDFMLLNGFVDYHQIYRNFPDLVGKLWSPTNGQDVDEAVRSVTIPRPNAFQMVGFYYHMQSLYGEATPGKTQAAVRADARAKAEQAYRGAIEADSNPERKTRHTLRLVQFYDDIAGRLASTPGNTTELVRVQREARRRLQQIPGILEVGGRTIAATPDGALQPTVDQRLPIKFQRLDREIPSAAELNLPPVSGSGVLGFTTPATLRAGRAFFRAIGLGFVSNAMIRFTFSPFYEMFKFYQRGFFAEHFENGHVADTRTNRILLATGIFIVTIAGPAAALAGLGFAPVSPLARVLLSVALFAAANVATHALLNGALDFSRLIARVSIERRIFSARPAAVAALSRQLSRPLSADDAPTLNREIANALRGLFPVRTLGVGQRSLRNEGLQAITAEIEQGKDLDRNLARLSLLLQKGEAQFTDVRSAVSGETAAKGASLAIQVFDGNETDITASFTALRDGLKEGDAAVVYAPADKLGTLAALVNGRSIRLEIYNPQSIDLEATVLAEADARPLARVKVLLSKNITLSPEALSKLSRLENSQYNVSIYLFLASIAVTVTTQDLENMARVARLIATQA